VGASLRFAGGRLGADRHVCALFNGLDEEHRVLRSFITDGLDGGDKGFHIATVAFDIMRTHPVVIVGEVLQENPFFVPPDRFLLELRERRLARTSASMTT
jgi:hypothetical protein